MVSSTLVNISDDAELRLITLLCESEDESFLQECTTYLSEGNISKLLLMMLHSSSSSSAPSSNTAIQTIVQHMEPITEVIATFSLLSAMIQRLESPETIRELLQSLMPTICNNQGEATDVSSVATLTERKMTILSSIYNMMNKSYKCMLLERMIQLAATNGSSANVSNDGVPLLQPETTLGRLLSSPIVASSSSAAVSVPQLPPIVSMLQSWNVPELERRSIYSTICNILPSSDIRRQQFLLLLIESYSKPTGSAKIDDDTVIQTVKQVTIGTIRDPVTLFRDQRNLLSQPIVQQVLQQQDLPLLALLTVFQEGTMTDYEKFLTTHGGDGSDVSIAKLFSTWGLDPKVCVRYMRILSLCTLAIGQDVITYGEISTALHLNSTKDDVESWIIASVNSGLLQAKMDQLQEIVMIERCVVRKFDIVQWKKLQIQLSSWKDHVGSILDALKQQNNHQEMITTTDETTTTTTTPQL